MAPARVDAPELFVREMAPLIHAPHLLDTVSKRALDGTLIPLSSLSAGQAAPKLEAGLTAMGGKYGVV
jgi:hypothetical protein